MGSCSSRLGCGESGRSVGAHRRLFFWTLLTLLQATAGPALGAEDPPDPTDALWAEIQAASDRGDLERAATLLSQLVVLEPDDPISLRELARIRSWQGKYDESLQYYDLYLKRVPNDLDVRVERARTLGWAARYEEAEVEVRRVLAVEPEHLDANLLLAAVLEWSGRPDEAAAIYAWVLRLDPKNPTALTARQERPTPAVAVGGLEWGLVHVGDQHGFLRFGTKLGVRFSPPSTRATGLSFKPFASGGLLRDPDESPLFAAGGGLNVAWKLSEGLDLEAEGLALHWFGNGQITEWGAAAGVEWLPLPFMSLAFRLDTLLWGTEGQSARTLVGGVRAWRGTGSLWLAKGRFTAFGQWASTLLTAADHPNVLAGTGLLQPMVRVVGSDPRLQLGYRLWYTGYSRPAPAEFGYWSPSEYFTHQGVIRLEGDFAPAGGYYTEVGGGMGHEWSPPVGTGTEFAQGGEWIWFPVVGGAAGLKGRLTETVDAGLKGWTVFSQRDWRGTSSHYVLWRVEAELLWRW